MIEATTHTGPVRRLLDGAGRVLSFVIGAVLGTVLLLTLLGIRPMVVFSGSMTPSLEPGDVILSRPVHPGLIRAGDVITFDDPTRPQARVTHRVVLKEPAQDGWSFLTRGDANTGTERWSIAPDKTVGRLAVRIPHVGRMAAFLADPAIEMALVAAAASIIAGNILRRIWAD
jgi:signal peptidase I